MSFALNPLDLYCFFLQSSCVFCPFNPTLSFRYIHVPKRATHIWLNAKNQFNQGIHRSREARLKRGWQSEKGAILGHFAGMGCVCVCGGGGGGAYNLYELCLRCTDPITIYRNYNESLLGGIGPDI